MSESPRFRPLEEPLRWGDVLVMRSRAPLAARFRPRLLRLWPLFALGLAHAGIWSLSFRVKADFAGMDFEELAVIACMMCLFGLPVFALAGAWLAAHSARRWRNEHRLLELVITPIRPLSLGQAILAPALAIVAWSALLLFLGLAAPLAFWRLEYIEFNALFALIAANCALAGAAAAWAQLNFALAHRNAWRAWLEFLFWAYAMGLLFIPAIGLFALLCGASAAMSLPFEEMLVGLSILPTALSGVLLYCFARAEAAHFERFTFDRIDLPQA